MDSLERDLEIYTREARKHERLAYSYRALIKKTEAKIRARNVELANAETETNPGAQA